MIDYYNLYFNELFKHLQLYFFTFEMTPLKNFFWFGELFWYEVVKRKVG